MSLSALLACSSEPDTTTAPSTEYTLPAVENYHEDGDLSAIRTHGKLRILTLPLNDRWLPRRGSSFSKEMEMAIKLAEQLQLEPVFVHVNALEALIPALNAGQGDIITANFTITESRKEQVAFTVPVAHAYEHLVARTDDTISDIKALDNREIAYQAQTAWQDTIEKLQLKRPEIKSRILPGQLNMDQIIDQLANKQIDLSIMDSNISDVLSGYRNDFKIGLALTDEQPLAWAIRKNSPELLKAANQFLTHEQLTTRINPLFKGDLDDIKKRRTLRVITRNNAATYFLWRGELLGFEYELVKAFAKQQKLRLEIITAPDHSSQIPMLQAGQGDIIASFMTITENRKKQGVVFSRPHHIASEVIVARADDNTLKTVDDLKGRSLYVRKSSTYWQTLQALRHTGLDFKLIAVPETLETEAIIGLVASGEYDLTLADNHLLDIELTWRDDIQAAFSIGEPQGNAWGMRPENPQLIKAVNDFLKKQHKSLFYNVTFKKYFKNSRGIKRYREQRIDLNPDGALSPYDDLVKKYAQMYEFDWRLLVALMYQESRFNPQAKSWVGAQGLMQVMPRTGKEMGINNLKDPEQGIKAGAKYLNWVRDRFEKELSVKNRMWFALASYNAGQGHVKDARRLARQQGLNPNHWFDNVEKAMLLLSQRKYSRKARYGYVRGAEPVNYVREIRTRYLAYIRLAKDNH